MSYADLAVALDVTVPAVKSLLVRARIGLVEAAEARDADCERDPRRPRCAPTTAACKASGRARRHMRDCDGCREYRGALRGMRRSFAALAPVGVGPARAGRQAARARRRPAAPPRAARPRAAAAAAVASGGAAAATACKVAAVVCTAAIAPAAPSRSSASARDHAPARRRGEDEGQGARADARQSRRRSSPSRRRPPQVRTSAPMRVPPSAPSEAPAVRAAKRRRREEGRRRPRSPVPSPRAHGRRRRRRAASTPQLETGGARAPDAPVTEVPTPAMPPRRPSAAAPTDGAGDRPEAAAGAPTRLRAAGRSGRHGRAGVESAPAWTAVAARRRAPALRPARRRAGSAIARLARHRPTSSPSHTRQLLVRRGRRSGLFTIVAVHSTARGPALGGCRMWTLRRRARRGARRAAPRRAR